MGSRSKNVHLAYIAGFLDGDGSLMLQLKKRADTKKGVRFMATICFYQDSRHESPLYWIHDFLSSGYISKRKDGITELRINGFESVREILTLLKPYVRFKEKQVDSLIKATTLLSRKSISKLTSSELKLIVDLMFEIKNANYKSFNSQTKEELYKRLDLTP